MPSKNVAGAQIAFNDEGYMVNPKDWNRDIALALAKEEGISLADQHWKVIDFIRQDGEASGSAPNVRRLTKLSGVSTKELYGLFPGGPAKKAARIAGYPKPQGCI